MLKIFQRHESVCLIAIAWLAYSAWTIMIALHGNLVLITDDAMRLTEVRDFLNGQSWYDTTQWRMNTPFGLTMHWSRLIDAGIAAAYLLFRTVMNPAAAESVTLYVWPMLPFLVMLAGLYRIALRFGGQLAALLVLVLALSCVALWSDFAPGSLDHDNVLLALAVWMLAFLIDSANLPRNAAYAALAAAASLTIAIESLPYVLTAAAAVAVLWIGDPQRWRQPARYFGLAFAAACALFLVFAVAWQYRVAPACDTYSSIYAALAVVGGVGLASVTLLRTPAFYQRALAGAALLAILIGVASLVDVNCLRGPYAEMDPRLSPIWLSRIIEAQPAFVFVHIATSEFVFSYVYALAGLIASIILLFLANKDDRAAAGVICAFAAVSIAVATLQFRGVTFAVALTLPSIAWLVGLVFRSSKLKGIAAPLAGVLALALSTGTAFAIVGGTLIEPRSHMTARLGVFESQIDCGSPKAMLLLSNLPRGRVASFVDQGPGVLAYTADSAIAGPYHRDASGILDTYTLFTGTPRSAQAILRGRGIDYVMICRASDDWKFYLKKSVPDSLIRKLAAGAPPAWLHPAGKDQTGNVEIYAVDKSKLN
ncbi:MAG TPA: hypothetical protein VHW02_02485 [Rhizomicrobium sp.]|jgi:hypothetical protein|nr:hypothetical protein [Rhizomicrobium sp.]